MALVGIIQWISYLNRLVFRLKGKPKIKAENLQMMQELRLGAGHSVAFNLLLLFF